jgi:SAM-dependent methyltransferase
VLARSSPAHITAIDSHPPYVEALNREARRLGIADRLAARVGDMCQLGLAPASFDVIWCEGAIYNIGFEPGLRAWRPLLRPGGHLAVSEVCWAKPDPPEECAAFWAKEYPAIRDPAALLAAIGACGYETVGHFAMPPSSWWDDYYGPLQRNLIAFRARHRDEPDAQQIADGVQREIDIWHAYSDFYSYHFLVARAL